MGRRSNGNSRAHRLAEAAELRHHRRKAEKDQTSGQGTDARDDERGAEGELIDRNAESDGGNAHRGNHDPQHGQQYGHVYAPLRHPRQRPLCYGYYGKPDRPAAAGKRQSRCFSGLPWLCDALQQCHQRPRGSAFRLPRRFPERLNMKLTAKAITVLILPPGKSDVIHFDEDLPRFGYRLRHASDGKILRSWIVQYKKAGRSSRVRIGDASVIPPEAARAEAKRILARVDLGEDPASDRRDRREKDRYSLHSVIDEYLETRRPPQTDRERKDKSRVRPKTYRELRRYLLDTFRPLHTMPIDRVTRKDIAFHLAHIKRERGVSVEGCARAALNKFFSWAMTMGLIEHNPVIGTPMPGRGEPRSRVLSDEELVAIWRACPD